MKHPIVLIITENQNNVKGIIKGITKGKRSDIPVIGEGTLWTIVNKYYKANVNLLPFFNNTNPDDIDFDSVEALIIHVNNLMGESLSTANERKAKCVKALARSEVNILLCDKCDALFPREQALVWCLDNDFQLIELLEEPEPSDISFPIEDHYGIDRVVYTLHTNAWSNHEMLQNVHHSNVHSIEEEYLEEGEDCLEHMDQFCKLFSQMSSVATNASSMSTESRKSYAEQVVKAFWKAIDGDESELQDNLP